MATSYVVRLAGLPMGTNAAPSLANAYMASNGEAIVGLYPKDILVLSETTLEQGNHAHFLGMNLTSKGKKINIDVFDKRREFGFPIVNYPHILMVMHF